MVHQHFAHESSGSLVVCLTGASGTIYGRRLAARLSLADASVHLVVSDGALAVLAAEEGIRWRPGDPMEPFFEGVGGFRGDRITVHPADCVSPLASGSVPWRAAAVLPCSTASLAAVAAGAGRHLVHRVCDVALKERRPLVVCVREMPLSPVHLENMLRLSRMGAVVAACAPGFYHRPKRLLDLVDFVVDRVARHMGVDLGLIEPWRPG